MKTYWVVMLAMAALAVLALAATACAEPPSTKCLQGLYRPSWPVVQVASGRTGQLVMGTGVPIGGTQTERIFVTSAHTVSAYSAPIMLVSSEFTQPASLLAVDQAHDVALLSASLPRSTTLGTFRLVSRRFGCGRGGCPVPGNRGQFQIGPPASNGACGPNGCAGPTWGGFSPDAGQFRYFEAPTSPYGPTGSWLRAEGLLMDGMSGGPVYDQEGLLGVIVRRSADGHYALAVATDWLYPWAIAALEIQAPPDAWLADYTGFGSWQPVSWSTKVSTVFRDRRLFPQ